MKLYCIILEIPILWPGSNTSQADCLDISLIISLFLCMGMLGMQSKTVKQLIMIKTYAQALLIPPVETVTILNIEKSVVCCRNLWMIEKQVESSNLPKAHFIIHTLKMSSTCEKTVNIKPLVKMECRWLVKCICVCAKETACKVVQLFSKWAHFTAPLLDPLSLPRGTSVCLQCSFCRALLQILLLAFI